LRYFSFYLSLILFLFSLWFLSIFDKTCFNPQFLFEIGGQLFGVDHLSVWFCILTVFIIPFCIVYSWDLLFYFRSYLIIIFFLEIFILFIFLTCNIFIFYIFFESVLIPMFLIIGIWGSQVRKVKASYYFFIYTLFSSILMLFGILVIYFETGIADLYLLSYYTFDESIHYFIWCFFFLSFLTKVPMFPLHIWLPEAHVLAPTVGSVILASLLLKLGGYGIIRISLSIFPIASIYFTPIIYVLCLLGMVYCSLTTLRQNDLKKIIAYSSVIHMSFSILGLFSFSHLGIQAGIFSMLAHGLTSSALFFLVGMLYDRTKVRLIIYFGGLCQGMPIFSFFLCFFSFSNVSFPATAGFVGELLILIGLFEKNSLIFFISLFGNGITTIFCIWLIGRIIFGNYKVVYSSKILDLSEREIYILFPFLFLVLLLGIYPKIILDYTYCYGNFLLFF